MAKRARKRVRSIYSTVAEVDAAMAEMVETEAAVRTNEAAMNEALTAVREEYEEEIEEGRAKLANVEAQVALFCDDHRELFGAKKTLSLTHGEVNYRLSPPKTKTLRKWTWKLVIETLQELGKRFARFLSVKVTVDKNALLKAHAAGDMTDEQLAKFGVEVVQEETFAVAPRYEQSEQPVEVKKAG